jgi:hypothetical protein
VAEEENQIKHLLFDENTSLLNVAGIMNRDLYDSRRNQLELTKELV